MWVFFDRFVNNKSARELGYELTNKHEIFPKQDITSEKNPGSLIKLPLGIHKVTGNRCYFLDEGFEPYKEQFEFLSRTQKYDLQVQESPMEVIEDSFTLRKIKPCVLKAVGQGAEHGKRNRTGHIIATEYRKVFYSKKVVLGILAAWNLANNPPLDEEELNVILTSAFSKDYNYGCSKHGKLRAVLDCIGKCRYYKELRESKASNS